MPELPEVETVVRGLRDTVLGNTITSVDINAPAGTIVVADSLGPTGFDQLLSGRVINDIDRRGKNILISLSGGLTLWAHLKMTGHFYYLPESDPAGKHDLVVFHFRKPRSPKEPLCGLRFNDYRRFGRLRLFPNDELWQQPGLADLGPEPLEIAPDDFAALFKKTHRMTKPALLDQSFLAGIGNIYADESLWAARIHPRRLTDTISTPKLRDLYHHMQQFLKKAIRLMGTSVDSYAGVNGQPGGFQKYLQAYGREGQPCGRCGSKIVREKIGSRSAHYCRRCQRLR
ncbi:MAG: bifunctional DNA-formamidopyrimidine glycosylase/DNA-(apurinic or apyrimidinic site) lyase [bacterium]